MATLSSSAEQTSDLLQKLSLDSQTKTLEMSEPTSKIQPSDRSVTPVLSNFMDPAVCYLPNGYQSYYYGVGRLFKVSKSRRSRYGLWGLWG
uniref:Uncharacterized protein n=1 Tax=Salix viminalis TaxID=40686 RepID=A0A6N2K6G8_SALVM